MLCLNEHMYKDRLKYHAYGTMLGLSFAILLTQQRLSIQQTGSLSALILPLLRLPLEPRDDLENIMQIRDLDLASVPILRKARRGHEHIPNLSSVQIKQRRSAKVVLPLVLLEPPLKLLTVGVVLDLADEALEDALLVNLLVQHGEGNTGDDGVVDGPDTVRCEHQDAVVVLENAEKN